MSKRVVVVLLIVVALIVAAVVFYTRVRTPGEPSIIPAVAGYINENPVFREEFEYVIGGTVRFYDDRLVFDGDHIMYNDIEAIRYNFGTGQNTYWVRYDLILANGERVRLQSGRRFGNVNDEIIERVQTFVSVFYRNVVVAVAQRAIGQIRDGATLNIGGITVSSYEAIRGDNVINIENYSRTEFFGNQVRVISVTGRELARVSRAADNAYLLRGVLNNFFTSEDRPDIEEEPISFFQEHGYNIIWGVFMLIIIILSIFACITDNRGFFSSIYVVFVNFLKGVIPALALTQLIWWIITSINGWPMDSWFIFF